MLCLKGNGSGRQEATEVADKWINYRRVRNARKEGKM